MKVTLGAVFCRTVVLKSFSAGAQFLSSSSCRLMVLLLPQLQQRWASFKCVPCWVASNCFARFPFRFPQKCWLKQWITRTEFQAVQQWAQISPWNYLFLNKLYLFTFLPDAKFAYRWANPIAVWPHFLRHRHNILFCCHLCTYKAFFA